MKTHTSLRVLRAQKGPNGVSQMEVALYLGIGQSTYSLIETGRREATPREKTKLARYFGCAIEDIFPSVAA